MSSLLGFAVFVNYYISFQLADLNQQMIELYSFARLIWQKWRETKISIFGSYN